jgi:discoidin domain receptor family protein 2
MLCFAESIVSYSAPRGEAESVLEDLSYDGILDGNYMRGGLGQLVDGVYGGDRIEDDIPGRLNSVYIGSPLSCM